MQSKVGNLKIQLYEDWMKEMVSQLFSHEYKIEHGSFLILFENFYEHPYQNKKCIRMVALDGKKVVGFQSFFYWPYLRDGKTINAYQSGNSLVHPDYRGQGIFQRLLNYIDEYHEHLQVDCLIGFPIDVSVGSLLRNGWKNILNLNWNIRMCSILSVVRKFNAEKFALSIGSDTEHSRKSLTTLSSEKIKLNQSADFMEWRRNYYDPGQHFTYAFSKANKNIIFDLKINIRKRFIKELIIGNIRADNNDTALLSEALRALFKAARKSGRISIVSICYNISGNAELKTVLEKNGFKKIKNEIFFCVKPFKYSDALLQADNWDIYRGDIDTW
jgi:GNAT superfamily N-acetyltransferase